MAGRWEGASSTSTPPCGMTAARRERTKLAGSGSAAAGGASRARGAGGRRCGSSGNRVRSAGSATRSAPRMLSPAGARAAAPPSVVRCQIAVPPSRIAHAPGTWKVKTGAPTTRIRSCRASAAATASGAAARCPAKSGWSSGKPRRGLNGLVQTGARSRSPSATRSGPAPSSSTSGPETMTGCSAPARASASRPSAAGSGVVSAASARCGGGSHSAAQSSAGMETKHGPRGRCMAMRCACAMAAGTSVPRGGSTLHFT